VSFDIELGKILVARSNHYPADSYTRVIVIRVMFYLMAAILMGIILFFGNRLVRSIIYLVRKINEKPKFVMEDGEELASSERV
jgi:hypothetical protein